MAEGLDIRVGIHPGRCPSGPGDDGLRLDRSPHPNWLEVDPVRLNAKRQSLPVPSGVHPSAPRPPRNAWHPAQRSSAWPPRLPPEPARADHDDTAGKPATAPEGNDPEPDASDKTPATAVEDESEEHIADQDEAEAAAGEHAHTAEDDTDAEVDTDAEDAHTGDDDEDEEVVESVNGEQAEPSPDQDTKHATTEADPETIVKPLRAIEKKLVDIQKSLLAGEGITKENMGILDVLALIREATDKHTAWISSLVGRLPLPRSPAGTDPGGEITPTEEALLTVMGSLDQIVLILNGTPPEEDAASPEEPADQPREIDPDVKAFHAVAGDLSRQITTDRSNYSFLAWAGAGIAARWPWPWGFLIQQQFAPLAVPDPTLGWKDRVWARAGPTLAKCMSLEDAGAGDCIVTITTPGE